MSRLRSFTAIFVVTMFTLLFTSNAVAVCDQSGASQPDRDLWNMHGCWQDFFLWQFRAYDIREGDWKDRGWYDACNQNMEYPKHWNAAYLVTYGLADNNDQSFHGTIDYRATAEAAGSLFHDSLNHTASDDPNNLGKYIHHIFGSNEIQTTCAMFSTNSFYGNPAARAADWMHEGWHGWEDKYGWDGGSAGGHFPCQMQPDGSCRNGNCTINGCDYFYFHGIASYVFGALWETDGTANRFHSPNQVEVEFSCDVADQPQPWVPKSVRDSSKAEANARSSQRFINGPGYYCGDPRPW